MSILGNLRFVLVAIFATAISLAGFTECATARTLQQDAGQQGSGGQGQAQKRPAPKPQRPPRPQPGKPSDRPTTQPVRPQPGKPSPGRPQRPGRPSDRPTIQPVPGPRPQPGKPGYRPPSRPYPNRPPGYRPPPYNWRPGDNDRMRRYYRRNFGYINRGRRPVFVIGGYISFGDRGYFRPVPPHLLAYLPPPPPGYVIGYFDGYTVVYDPVTFEILSFVDLLN